MNREPTTSHEDAIVQSLRDDPAFAVEYLQAAKDDVAEPKVLLIALRQLAKANRTESTHTE